MTDGPSLILYIAGSSPRSRQAIEQLRWMCDVALQGRYAFGVVDILAEPHLAVQVHVLATPTLIYRNGVRVVGDLSDTNKVINTLGLARHE